MPRARKKSRSKPAQSSSGGGGSILKPMIAGAVAGVALFALSLIVGWFIALGAIKSYLESDDFKLMIASETAKSLKADTTLGEVTWKGQTSSVYVKNFEATGYEDASFSSLKVHGFDANFTLTLGHLRECIRDNEWKIPAVVINKLEMVFDGERRIDGTWAATNQPATAAPAAAETVSTSAEPKKAGLLERLLPQEVKIDHIELDTIDLVWRDGETTHRATGMSILATPTDAEDVFHIVSPSEAALTPDRPNGYVLIGAPGSEGIRLDVRKLNFRWNPTTAEFFVDNAMAKTMDGDFDMTGEMKLGDDSDLNLRANLRGLKMDYLTDDFVSGPLKAFAPVIPDDWAVNFSGIADVSATLTGDFDTVHTNGNVEVRQGRIDSQGTILETLATLSGNQRFLNIALNSASANFTRDDQQLLIHDIHLQSDGLGRVQGRLGIGHDKELDGALDFGVVPGVFRFQLADYLQTKLFTDVRDNHHWTTIQISGTLDDPKADFDDQLKTAALAAPAEIGKDALEQLGLEGDDLKKAEELLNEGIKALEGLDLKGLFGN